MTSHNKQWQDVKENYLKLIEQNLAQVDHPRRTEILANVREHLDSKYTELSPEQQNWENFQQIITEMGPPEEYAELLGENNTSKAKTTSGINTFLAILFVIVLAAVGGYLIYTAQNSHPMSPAPAPFKFEPDTQVLGKWVAVDFVRDIEDFIPGQKQWKGDLYLKGLTFYEDGTTSGPWTWTKGWLWHPGDKTKARYQIKDMQGGKYLFMEWMSGDVTIRGQKPWYYVLKKEAYDD